MVAVSQQLLAVERPARRDAFEGPEEGALINCNVGPRVSRHVEIATRRVVSSNFYWFR